MAPDGPLAEQYKDAANLGARIALHARFSTAEVNWYRWVFDYLELPEAARVLELGCGSTVSIPVCCTNG